MTTKSFNKFELLLFAAAEDAANDVAEEFINVDTSRVEISPQGRKKVERYIRKAKRKTKLMRPVKVILVACLIALSVAFTACMAIPQIREAMTEAVIQWYEDFFAIGFSDEPHEITTSPPAQEEIPAEPPTEIEKKAYASYLHQDLSPVVIADFQSRYEVYYMDSDDNPVFILVQQVITDEPLWNDAEGASAQEVMVTGHKAYMVSDNAEPGVYKLIWQDHYYRYLIYGYFEYPADLIKIAENIKLK